MKIKNIVFDLGGVLLHFDFEIIVKKLSNRIPGQEQNIRNIIFRYMRDFDEGKIKARKFYKNCCSELKLNIGFEDFKTIWEEIFRENKEMMGFLKKLDTQKYNLFLLSNTDELHFHYVLKKYPAINKIKNFVLSYEAGCMKPEKGIYELLLKKYCLDPKETLFIDDMEENVNGARSLSIVSHKYQSMPEFKKFIKACGISS